MEVPTNLAFIAPGVFRMGSPTNEVDRLGDVRSQTAVVISRGFWMGKFEVTQAEYLPVLGSNPSKFKEDPNQPVESVTWSDATNYCARLTQRERVAGRIRINSVYRLPTEAEWEYSCRAWTSTRFPYGDDPGYTNLTNYAWYGSNNTWTTHLVGQKLPNPWGLYDMQGNVAELCQDWWAFNLPGGIALDPQGPALQPATIGYSVEAASTFSTETADRRLGVARHRIARQWTSVFGSWWTPVSPDAFMILRVQNQSVERRTAGAHAPRCPTFRAAALAHFCRSGQ